MAEFVALLAEGVDRNPDRRRTHHQQEKVALLAEGVDRNNDNAKRLLCKLRRPPRGGRG